MLDLNGGDPVEITFFTIIRPTRAGTLGRSKPSGLGRRNFLLIMFARR